jgi:transcriptional regulator with XRE-family HTH domain
MHTNVSTLLKSTRLKEGKSIRNLIEEAAIWNLSGISIASLYRWEKGLFLPDIHRAVSLAILYEVNWGDFIAAYTKDVEVELTRQLKEALKEEGVDA